MDRRLLGMAIGLGLAGLVWATPAAAFPMQMDVHVPFAFHVGRQVLPAGNYVIQSESSAEPGLLMIRSTDGRHSALFLTTDGYLQQPARAKAKLSFDRVDQQNFLHAVRLTDERDVLPVSRSEARAAIAAARNLNPASHVGRS
jgi:hypothetical protein